jgi:beta-lactam-binding protein with PASTA domain
MTKMEDFMASPCSAAQGPMQTLDSRNHNRSVRMTSVKGLLLLVAAAAGLASTGCKKVAVPNVVQLDLEQAKQTITTAGLKPGNITGTQSTGSYVTAQTPPPGQQVKPNTTIDLTVEAPIAVPDLVKSKLTDAVSVLQGAGLSVAFIKQPTLKLFGGGKVVLQTPDPNTLVRRGTVVTLTVASPPDLGALVGLVTKEPAYEKLNPEYRQVLDQFLK